MVDPFTSRLTRALALALLLASVTDLAHAQARGDLPSAEIAADTPRPFFARAGLGVAVRLDGYVPAAFRITEELGLHLDGVPTGPFVALALAQDIASYFSMQIGVRAGWDLELLRKPDFSILLAPSAALAFAFDAGTDTGDWAYFLVQPALRVGLLLLDRMLAIWIHPIGVDVYIGEHVHGGWAATAGAALAF